MSAENEVQSENVSNETNQERSSKEINFEKFRKKYEAQEKKNAELEETIVKQNEMLGKLQDAFSNKDDEDDIESLHSDDLVSKSHLDKWKKNVISEAVKEADKRYDQIQKSKYMERLELKYPDYHETVNADTAGKLEKDDPEYAELLGNVPDEYKRRELAYKRIKTMKAAQVSAQATVDNNLQKNYYYTPQGQGNTANPMSFEFDVTNPEARKKAYAKLKSAQKRGF